MLNRNVVVVRIKLFRCFRYKEMLKWTLQYRPERKVIPNYCSKMPSRQPVGDQMDTIFRRKSMQKAQRKSVNENKENFDTFFRSPSAGRVTALHDLSNGQSPNLNRSQTQRRFELNSSSLLGVNTPRHYGSTLPSFEAEYSPCDNLSENLKNGLEFKNAGYLVRSTKRHGRIYDLSTKNWSQFCPEESLSSSRIGDATLDKMIDAIIESAKKESCEILESSKSFCYKTESIEELFEPSIHEMEVKTPPNLHLKRQRVLRRKHKSELLKDHIPPSKLIGLTLPEGIPSPETPVSKMQIKDFDELENMETPQDMVLVVDSMPSISTRNPQGCSTPTAAQTNSIKRCLSFSPGFEDESMDEKRKSLASSITSSGTFPRIGSIKGSVDIAIFAENKTLNVHVIRCRDLQRPNGSTAVNAYVKVAFLPTEIGKETGLQRTAVHRNSSRPFFDHRFKFDIQDEKSLTKRIQLAVWHRDRELKRSEFLGCISFSLKNVIKTGINGSYKLQPQTCLTNPIPPILFTSSISHPTHPITSSYNSSSEMAAAADRRQASVEEDVISIDSASAAASHLIDANTGQPITLSKKAIHQRDADENLFLRFLELDPPADAAAPAPAPPATNTNTNTNTNTTAATGGNQQRRMSTFKPALGRTPFTITKRLTRTTEKGFGFSIVWTHPPRVEKIEPGLSADKNGILPGDYVIFVDKHNVVTMPEADVLNLIRSQGSSLTLEIFRRSSSSGVPGLTGSGVPALSTSRSTVVNGVSKSRVASVASNYTAEEMSPALKQSSGVGPRSSTACSNASVETTKRRLHLPQVTFSKENSNRYYQNVLQSIAPSFGIEDHRRKLLLQLISREQNFVAALQFGMERFVTPLLERKDLISPHDHRTLFQNIDELSRISEDILEQLVQDDHDPHLNFASRVYLSKTTAICAAYKKYCNGIKRADCVLVNKSRQPGSDFVTFITEPQVPRKRPDLTMFIHRPLQHFREILKLMQLLSSHCHVDSEEHKNFTTVINELQAAYREITVGGGLMEPLGEGRPLLTLQDLEARMVFTRCKPFTLGVQGRQWIFGGDLSRVEGRSIKPYWTLLFSDIIVFAKVSRDRVLFITEEPLPIANIVDSCFNIRKKTTEFRITVDPNGRLAESPTGYCAPDLTTPKRNARRKSLILRAPSLELKAVWQNLLQRQIFLVNAALGSTPLSSPLDSPDVLNTLVPLSDIGATTTSMASIKISSMDSINIKNQQQNRNTNPSHQIEQLIDEKCRILNKTGTPKGSALHLANWMKGQLDKQQEQARLAAQRSRENINKSDGESAEPEEIVGEEEEEEEEERITYWTKEQLEKRTKELNLAKENGSIRPLHPNFGGKRLSGAEEVAMSDNESDMKSPSRSTTSDSQITVRSSPIANVVDKLSVCRHCHKNCKQKLSPSPPLLSNSLKVQHSQSPNRCCQLSSMVATSAPTATNGIACRSSPTVSSTSSTVTGERAISEKTNSRPNSTAATTVPSTPTSTNRLLMNGNCSGSESDRESRSVITTTTSISSKTTTVTTSSICQKNSKLCRYKQKNIPCNCKCTPEDFTNATLSPDELKQETCKLIDDVTQLKASPNIQQRKKQRHDFEHNIHKNCKCICKNNNDNNKESDDREDPKSESDDMSLVLIGLAQFTPAAKLVNSEAFVPTISIVPPTPDSILSKTTTNIWDNSTRTTTTKLTINNIPRQAVIENIPEDSPDESPQDEEPPYRSLNTTLRRYGTMSSLEKLPSEDVNEHEDASSEEVGEEEEDEHGDDDDIEVITREVFNNDNNQTSLRNWTARAGSYVAGKMSFFEESRAFIDRYLGRWNQEQENEHGEEEQMDECTSGATSGEEVWGTPTSGGDNDDMQMPNSENTQSSPTKSSSSLNGDDDTELMMDELLMAPPMTASTIRGLLPRRRLEPLFEEETESDEEKTQQDSDEIKKGETASNGHDLEDSIGNSSDEAAEEMEQDRQQGIMQERRFDVVPKVVVTTAPSVLPRTSNAVAMMTSPATASTTPNIVRRAKFSPPPPPPRRLLLTQSDLKTTQRQIESPRQQVGQVGKLLATADTGSSAGVRGIVQTNSTIADNQTNNNQAAASHTNDSVGSTDHAENRQSAQKLVTCSTTEDSSTTISESPSKKGAVPGSGLSPRLEMRLALNHDILGDEDLISYAPGPDLTTILGHDLSTFHRLTGRDLLNRSANRIQPKEAVISYSQQRNSKMDTPTLNRKRQQQQHHHQNRSIWNSSAFADRIGGGEGNVGSNKSSNNSSEGSKLSDLELLAKREMIYCTSQLKSGSPVKMTTKTMSTSSLGTAGIDSVKTKRKLIRAECSSITMKSDSRTNRFFNFLARRNSENHLTKMFSRDSLTESIASSNLDRRMLSPRKDNDKPPLNRRFWKQLTKRRRAHSVSEIIAS